MLRIIQRYPAPAPATASLSETAADGERWLELSSPAVLSTSLWNTAVAEDAVGVVVHLGDGYGVWLAEDVWAVLSGTPRDFQVFPEPPTHMEALQASTAAPVLGGGFVHTHTHSEYSALDGLSTMRELAGLAAADGNPALAITDHGVCAGHPALQRACDEVGVKPIFGMEAYFIDDRLERPATGDVETAKRLRAYTHLILLAKDDEGLHNLWALSTEGYRDGFYYKPRIDWDSLRRHSRGLVATSACLGGPISRLLLNGETDRARARLARLLELFGDDLYVEIQPADLDEQRRVNPLLVQLAHDLSVPLVAAADGHHPLPSTVDLHKTWLACQTSGDNEAYWHFDHTLTEAEVRSRLSYLSPQAVDEAVDNTVAIADKCNARIESKIVMPVFYRQGGHDRDAERLREICEQNWGRIVSTLHTEQVYRERFEREYDLISRKQYCGYFLMVADYCLDPSTPVLTEDLRWVEIGKLEVGDKLAGFDEHKILREKKSHRYWRSAEVVDTRRVVLNTYRVVLEDGTETTVSEDHQWLVASPCGSDIRWIRTKDLKLGQRAQRLVPQWDEPDTWKAGYLAGIFDGEGCLNISKVNSGGRSLALTFAQKDGVVLDTALSILDSWGFDYSVSVKGDPEHSLKNVQICGRRAEVLRLLGMVRPQRLLAKLDMDLLGRLIAIDSPAVISVEPLGLGEVVALKTTTGTLVAQGFAHHNCVWAKDRGILVGPGRGSGAGSLIAFLLRITEVDPVHFDILFERFITEGRKTLPDFDVDFPASKRPDLQHYIRDKYGDEYVLRVGTHLRYKSKGIINKLFRVAVDRAEAGPEAFVDGRAVSAIITEAESSTAGLGLSWDDLWAQEGDRLEPYRSKYPWIFEMAEQLVGRLNSYGQHPAGVIISTDGPLLDRLPLRRGDDDGPMITQFEFDDLDAMGLIKFDILTIRTLDTLQATVDGAYAHFGIKVNVYDFVDEYADPMVWEQIRLGNTLGMFQIETTSGTRLAKEFAPERIEDLADMGSVVRPGPMRSGLTDAYLRRRAGQEPVVVSDPRLETILAPTQGVMIYQEQVMQACMVLAGYDSTEADGVRKILGKKKVDQVIPAGHKFVDGCVAGGMDKAVAQLQWDQMAEFAKYGFGKAHAVSYALITYWTAWWKTHYPVPALTALLSTVDDDRVPEFVREARRLEVEILPPDINVSGVGFKPDGLAIRYGLDKIKGVGEKAVAAITQGQPYTGFEDYLVRKGSAANSGVTLLLARVGAFDTLVSNRRWLVSRLEADKDGSAVQCVWKIPGHPGPNGLPCTFDWESEARPVNPRNGKLLKAKPLPKRCTRACRSYTAPPPIDPATIGNYTEAEIRTVEQEMLGVQLSSTVFDSLGAKDREVLLNQARLMHSGLPGLYLVAGTVNRARPHRDRLGNEMGFFNLVTEAAEFDIAAFSDVYATIGRYLKIGRFLLCEIHSDGSRYQLRSANPLDR